MSNTKQEESEKIMNIMGWKRVPGIGEPYERVAKRTPLDEAYAVYDYITKKVNAEVISVLEELESNVKSYRTHDMQPPFPSAVPLSAIQSIKEKYRG